MRTVVPIVLAVVLLATVTVFGSIPAESAAPYESDFFEWVVYLWKWWGIALLFLVVLARFGSDRIYVEADTLSSIFHWKNFPANWAAWYFFFLVVASYFLIHLTIGFIALYGGSGG